MNLKFIIEKKQTIVIISLLFLLIATIFTLFQPIRYSAKSKVLLVQEFDKEVDSYAIARSKTYLSEILAEVVTTYSFYDKVAQGEKGVDRAYFEKQVGTESVLKKWKETVEVSGAGDSGILEISVKHPRVKQAKNISDSILENLNTYHGRYHNNLNTKIKVMNSPVVGLSSPNIELNLIISFILGLTVAFAYIMIFPEPEHDLSIFKKKKKSFLEIQTMKTLDK